MKATFQSMAWNTVVYSVHMNTSWLPPVSCMCLAHWSYMRCNIHLNAIGSSVGQQLTTQVTSQGALLQLWALCVCFCVRQGVNPTKQFIKCHGGFTNIRSVFLVFNLPSSAKWEKHSLNIQKALIQWPNPLPPMALLLCSLPWPQKKRKNNFQACCPAPQWKHPVLHVPPEQHWVRSTEVLKQETSTMQLVVCTNISSIKLQEYAALRC